MSEEQEQAYACETCPMRARYDAKPTSVVGRFWRWHINFCPGWAKFFNSKDEETKAALREQYQLKSTGTGGL